MLVSAFCSPLGLLTQKKRNNVHRSQHDCDGRDQSRSWCVHARCLPLQRTNPPTIPASLVGFATYTGSACVGSSVTAFAGYGAALSCVATPSISYKIGCSNGAFTVSVMFPDNLLGRFLPLVLSHSQAMAVRQLRPTRPSTTLDALLGAAIAFRRHVHPLLALHRSQLPR